jgi:hypothetical protein
MNKQISRYPKTMEEVAPGIFVEWLCDYQIIAMHLTNTSRNTVNAYIEISIDIVNNWAADKPYLALKEVEPSQIVSRYFHFRTNEIGQRILERGLRGRSAIVCPHDTTADMVDTVIRMDGNASPHMQRKTFSKREQALDWLLQALMS